MATLCPLCETRNLKKGEKMVYCEGYKPRTDDAGEWHNDGECEFHVNFENKKFGKLTDEQVKSIISGKEVKNKKGDSIVLDLGNNQFFTKITYAQKVPDKDF